jgi:hypothetical protein
MNNPLPQVVEGLQVLKPASTCRHIRNHANISLNGSRVANHGFSSKDAPSLI